MTRTARLTVALLIALAAVLAGAFLTAPVPAPAQPTVPAPSDGGGDAAIDLDADGRYVGNGADGDTSTMGDGPAVRTTPQDGADAPAQDGAVTDQDGTVSATGTDDDGTVTADGDAFDPTADALPDDAPRVCVILDMGAAACDAFTHPAPGEISVAVIYSDDDERAIVETIAYDEHGPIDYVDFWEGETTPSE